MYHSKSTCTMNAQCVENKSEMVRESSRGTSQLSKEHDFLSQLNVTFEVRRGDGQFGIF